MPEPTIKERVSKLSPGSLRILKQRLASVPEKERATIYSQFSEVPELADIVGSSVRDVTAIQPTPAQTTRTDTPLWQKALNVFNAPFDWVSENVTEPFGAAVTAPFTPSTGTTKPGESWLARERREYEAWEEPEFTMPWGGKFRPTKGAVEFLPWLAPTLLSGGAGAAAKGLQAGSQAAKLAANVGKFGKAAESITGFAQEASKLGTAGKVVGTAAKLSPWGLAETATNKAVSLGITGVKKALGIGTTGLTKKALSDILDQDNVFVMTAADPSGKKLSAAENSARNKALYEKLVTDGYTVVPVEGKFGGADSPSFLVHGMDEQTALKYAGGAGQESIWGKKGIIYTADGSYNPTKKINIGAAFDDNYTGIGRWKFQSDIDWDTKLPAGTPAQTGQGTNYLHFSEKKGLTELDPVQMGTGQSGSEVAILRDYAPEFKSGDFTKRTYLYASGQKVEPRFKGKEAYTVNANLKIFDPAKASDVEFQAFLDKQTQIEKKLQKKLGAQFGGLEEHKTEIAYSAAKALGYDAFQTPNSVAVFKKLPVTTTQVNVPSGVVATGQTYKKTIYRGVNPDTAKLGGTVDKAFGDAPVGYYTDSEALAKEYAGKTGKVVQQEITLNNPYVMPEGGDPYTKAIITRARNKAKLQGLDVVGQEEAAAKALPETLKKRGYDGLVVKAKDGTEEVIPYSKTAFEPPVMSAAQIQRIYKVGYPEAVRIKEGLKAGKPIEELLSKSAISQPPVKPVVTAATAGTPPVQPPAPPTTAAPQPAPRQPRPQPSRTPGTVVMPQGFTVTQQRAIDKITGLIKESKGFRKATEEMYSAQKSGRIRGYEQALTKAKTTGLSNEEVLSKARAKLAGEYEQAPLTEGYEALREQLTTRDVNQLMGIIVNGQYADNWKRNRTFEAFQNLLLNKIPQDNELILLEETFGKDFIRSVLGKRSLGQRVWEETLGVLNAPRALLSSVDSSWLLRQGGVLSTSHPLQAAKTLKPALQAMFSDKNELMVDQMIKARPHTAILAQNGLYLAPRTGLVSASLTQQEEAFMSKLTSKIPFVRASNRMYITGLNDLRSRVAEQTLTMYEKAGIKYTPQDVKDLAQLINWSTGRGTLPKALEKSGSVLNTIFFSPKLILSRLELPTTVLPSVTKSALIRRQAWRTLLPAIGTGVGILTAARLSGAVDKIELDPRSADFGKLKIGNTRLDIWTGYAQYMRFAAQFATASRKTEGGLIQDANRLDLASRFAQTKFSPAVGLITDLMKGETYLGEELLPKTATGIGETLKERLMPLAVQDMWDAIAQDGLYGGILSSTGLWGVGVATYDEPVKRAEEKVAQSVYGMTWDEVGKVYGQAAQIRLSQMDSSIQEAQKEQDKRFAASSKTETTRWYDEGESIETTYRNAVKLASSEYRATGDGAAFKEKIDAAADARRAMYGARAVKTEFQPIVSYYNQPLTDEQKAKMNPMDVIRREYNQTMFSADMYDQFGNYSFQRANQKETDFLKKYGQSALDYLEEYQSSRWLDKPEELKQLEQAREILRPYWQIEDYVWSRIDSRLKAYSDEIAILEKTEPLKAKRALYKYPQILRARNQIARLKQLYKRQHPEADLAYRMYYR